MTCPCCTPEYASVEPKPVPWSVLADLHARHAADASTTFARLLNDLGVLIGDAWVTEPDNDRGEDR